MSLEYKHLLLLESAAKMYRREILWHGTDYDRTLSLETLKILRKILRKMENEKNDIQ